MGDALVAATMEPVPAMAPPAPAQVPQQVQQAQEQENACIGTVAVEVTPAAVADKAAPHGGTPGDKASGAGLRRLKSRFAVLLASPVRGAVAGRPSIVVPGDEAGEGGAGAAQAIVTGCVLPSPDSASRAYAAAGGEACCAAAAAAQTTATSLPSASYGVGGAASAAALPPPRKLSSALDAAPAPPPSQG